ncbi:MAG: cytochrome c oxidase subunit 3 [Phycisphaerales bacterium]|nr:cytochrome c oxidase subunit 3 [Phycisphaerales bacterium]
MANIVSPFEDPSARLSAGRFGMLIFIASLAMIFAASILAVMVVRFDDDGVWPPAGMPALPVTLLWSTIVLLASSATQVLASRAANRGDVRGLRRWMIITLALAIAFLAMQGWAWSDLVDRGLDFSQHLYAWTFYFLTGLHAIHVIGGVIPMCFVTARAVRLGYTREDHRGVAYVAMYWHFLDVAWIILYLTLLWAAGSLW